MSTLTYVVLWQFDCQWLHCVLVSKRQADCHSGNGLAAATNFAAQTLRDSVLAVRQLRKLAGFTNNQVTVRDIKTGTSKGQIRYEDVPGSMIAITRFFAFIRSYRWFREER